MAAVQVSEIKTYVGGVWRSLRNNKLYASGVWRTIKTGCGVYKNGNWYVLKDATVLYHVFVGAKPQEYGYGTVNGQAGGLTGIPANTSVQLVAVPNAGYQFEGWYVDGVRQPYGASFSYQVTGTTYFDVRFSSLPVLTENRLSVSWVRDTSGTGTITVSAQRPVASPLTVEVQYEEEFTGKDRLVSVPIPNGAISGSLAISMPALDGLLNMHIGSVDPAADGTYQYTY